MVVCRFGIAKGSNNGAGEGSLAEKGRVERVIGIRDDNELIEDDELLDELLSELLGELLDELLDELLGELLDELLDELLGELLDIFIIKIG